MSPALKPRRTAPGRTAPRRRSTVLLLLPLAVAAACGGQEAPEEGQGEAAVVGTPLPPAPARSMDPRVVEAREALGRGDAEAAAALVPAAARVAAEPEASLLRARLALLGDDRPAMEQALAAARQASPGSAAVTAASAELHAWAGMAETAEGELAGATAALQGAEPGPELLRARAVQLLSTQGGARAGLALLERALELDPELPFVGRALGQAHLLVGRSFMATDKAKALDHARQSLEWDPTDVDARVFLADALMTAGEWGQALAEYERVLEAGKDLRAEVALHYKNAGVVALAQGHRELALEHFVRARVLGLDDEQLGTGARVLEDEAGSRFEAALSAVSEEGPEAARALVVEALRLSPEDPRAGLVEASILVREAGELLEAGSTEGSEERLKRALELDPGAVDARLLLGHLLYAREAFGEAAEQWFLVVDALRLDGVELPEPLHVRLADALVRADRAPEAREVLEAYLVLEPTGRWVDTTRQLLTALGPEDPASPASPDPIDGTERPSPPVEGDGE
jgi:tetratricopeptide (TPR) repeat protein